MSAYYFGCWDHPGHCLWHTDGTHPRKERPSPLGDSKLPNMRGLDGGFAPKRRPDGSIFYVMQFKDPDVRDRYDQRGEECTQGEFLLHRVPELKISMMAWWDRTHGDSRSACNSAYIVDGTPTLEAMLASWPQDFPLQAKQMDAAGVKLVHVGGK
jgi:hypothetical protein